MLRKLKAIFLIPVLLFLQASASDPKSDLSTVDKLSYEIIVLNKSVGEFVAKRSDIGKTTEYSLQSNVSVWLFKPMNFSYQLSAQYENDVLVEAQLFNRMNDELKAKSSVQFDGENYQTNTKDGNVVDYDRAQVDYSAANLFFEEPGDRSSLFSENYGVDLAIQKVDDHRYKLTLPNGDYNYYDYERGRVTSVAMHRKLATVRLVLR